MEPKALIKIFLDRIKRLLLKTQVFHGVYILLTYLMGSYLLTCLLAWGYQSIIKWTWGLIGVFLGGLVYIIFIHFIRVIFTPLSQDDAALLADSHYPNLNNALINSSQLGRRLDSSQLENSASLEFIHELHRRTNSAINKIDPLTVINHRGIAFSRNCFLGTLASLILISLVTPDFVKNGYEHLINQNSPAQKSQMQLVDKKPSSPKTLAVNYSIESLDLTLNFPSYTGLKKKFLKSSNGNVRALPGTEVNISAKTNVPITGADLVFSNKDSLIMTKEKETNLKGSLLIKEKGYYQFRVKDQNRNKHLIQKKYSVELVKDHSPNIVLFLANPRPVYFSTDKVKFFYEGKDDFGINSVELIVLINGKVKKIPVKSFKKRQKEAKDSYTWPLSQIALNSGDEVQYYLEIKDNDNIYGPNAGQSEAYSFSIFDSKKEIENLIAMQEKMTEQMIALLANGLVKGASLKNQPANLVEWKQLFTISADELIEIVSLAQRIHDRGEAIDEFPQVYLNLLKNIISGLSLIRRNQIEALVDLQDKIYKPTQAVYKSNQTYDSINRRMTAHLEKDILFLVKMTNRQKLDRIMGSEKELNELTQTLREEFEKIKDGKSPQNSNELKNKINKIRETLQKIMSQLSRQMQNMPDEFINPKAFKSLKMENFSKSLEKMEQLVSKGQIEGAIEKLKQMMEDLQLLANQLNHAKSEMENFLDSETMETLGNAQKQLDQLKNRQQKIAEETTQINQEVRQQQSKQFSNELNILFSDILHDVDAIRELFKKDKKILKEHVSMKQLEKIINEEFKIRQKIKELSQETVSSNQSEKLNRNFQKLNEARKNHSKLVREKDSLRVNEFQSFKEAIPKLLNKYKSLSKLAKLQDLKEFANYFKQTYPDVLRWQNNLRAAPNLREDLSDQMDADMKQATRLNNEISKKLGSMLHAIRKNNNSAITKKQEKVLNRMAKEEHQMQEETEELSQRLGKLNRENPMIPPELSTRMSQTGRHMGQARKNLQKHNINRSIESENQALKGLNDTRDMLSQMMNSNGKTGKAQRQTPRRLGIGRNPDSRRGGSIRMQKERVRLPSEDEYQAPKEFREEILDAMKRQTPKNYQRMVMEYYKNLVK